MKIKQLANIKEGEQKDTKPLLSRLLMAESFLDRAIGLLRYGSIDENTGMFFARCRSIHTFFMRFPIDIVFLDADFRVVQIFPAVRPGMLVLCKKRLRRHTMETQSCLIAQSSLQVNDYVQIID